MTPEAGTTPLVSVVIPVHNAEAYLRQCLDSVLGQSLRDLEVIAVDDASSDGSGELLEAVSTQDRHLRVIRFPRNRGVSAARNAGLGAATGEFVAFVDADDYIDASMYETLVDAARSLDCEVVSCGIDTVDELGRQRDATPFPLSPGTRYGPSDMREHLHAAFAERMLWYPVRSLYRRDLLIRQELVFDEGVRKGEDSLFNLQVLHFADGVCAIADAMYHYRQHGGSVTARALASESNNIVNLAGAVLSFYNSHGYDGRAALDFYSHLLRSDLPTALVRLGARADAKSEIRALTQSAPVRAAFNALPLLELNVPRKVLLVLILARSQASDVLAVLLRAYSRWAS